MSELLDRYLRPREGWLSLGLLFVMLLSLAWSLQAAGWLPQAEFLVPVAFYAVIAGALIGLTRWSVAITLPVAAVLGAVIVLWTVGGEYFTDLSQTGRLLALRGETIDWTRIVFDRGYPPELSPYALAGGVVMWVTSFIAAYVIYRHHRVLDAILLVAAALIANLSATILDLFGYLILFVLAALLLWLRASLLVREEGWVRRRVTENAEVPSAIMRSGIAFIAGSIALAWVLTTVAVAAPLTGVWNNLAGTWNDLRTDLEGVVGGLSGGQSRFEGPSFGQTFVVSGSFQSNDQLVMRVHALDRMYLRTTTHDVYTGRGWSESEGTTRSVPAGEAFFPPEVDTPERPTAVDAFEGQYVTVELVNPSGDDLFAPIGPYGGYPVHILASTRIVEPGGQPLFGELEATTGLRGGQGYDTWVAISRATRAQLEAAGEDYPDAITERYLDVSRLSARTGDLAEDIVARAGAETPYAKAEALRTFLQRNPTFRYSNTAPVPGADQDLVDFFLFDTDKGRIGYCQYYASAMAMMARSLGIPARVAQGYSPGDRVADPASNGGPPPSAAPGSSPPPDETGIYEIRGGNAHAWAELYFPGYGWQIFEATKGIAQPVRSAGTDGPGATPPPGVNGDPSNFEPNGVGPRAPEFESFEPLPQGFRPGETPPDETRGGNALLIVAILVLVVGAGVWRLLQVRRNWRFLAPGERQWQRLAAAAGRAGVAQRPSETIYEYAGWLEEQIPARRPEIKTIADGKVWQSYSGRGMTGKAIARIEQAWARLRLPLVWLAIRRRVTSILPGH